MAEKVVRKLINMAKEKAMKKERRAQRVVAKFGMYPLNAPGMPPPGPNFLRHAKALGDDTVLAKIAKTKDVEYSPGDVLASLYRRALREPLFTLPVEVRAGQLKDAVFVPGHIWGEHMESWEASFANVKVAAKSVTGPHRADVMVIGKMPWKSETQEGRNLIDDSGRILIETCARLHINGLSSWYVTNLCKFMPPDGATTLKAGWIHDCLPLLHQELRIVRPKYILFLGADASKQMLGVKCGVSYMEGRVVDLTYPVHANASHPVEMHTAKCMTVLHPVNVARASGPHEARALERGLARFGLLISGADFTVETDIDHRVCVSLEEAEQWCHEMDLEMLDVEPKMRILAIDAEWEGQHAVNKNAWVATVQISWADRKAMCFHLRDETGKTVFLNQDGKPSIKRLARLLTERCNKYRIAGHFFVSDMEMLCAEGFDFRQGFFVPAEDAADGTTAWQRCMNGEGGLDTAIMSHAVEETGRLGLEHLLMRYTTCPRYDIELEDEIIEMCRLLGIKRSAMEGYGKVNRGKLIAYGNYDADGTRRLAVELTDYLGSDYEGNNAWEPFWEGMITLPAILEMHQTGMYVDRKRVDELTAHFVTARAQKEEQIKHESRWNADDNQFNVRSVQQVKEYLFGHELNGKTTKDGKPVRIRPPGAISLGVTPILDTSKPPKRWLDIVEQGRQREFSPSTGKQVLALLAQENPAVADQINQVRDYRFLDQALKSVLRPPKTDEGGEWMYEDDPLEPGGDGLLMYDAGIVSCIDDDGMVRTHLTPTAETGRWKSFRPNLMNISKTRDPDYERLLIDPADPTGKTTLYKHKLRSIFCAPPKTVSVPVVKLRNGKKVVEYEQTNWLGLEADLRGAELYGMAIMSGSTKMIDHAQRSINWADEGYDISGKHRCNCDNGKPLPKCKVHKYPHENFYDIHSNIAVLAFKLKCHPSKAGLADILKSHIRNVAKTVIFGLAYGRGAKAIAMAAREQRKKGEPEVSVADAQAVIDAVFEMYPELVPFFAEARDRALKHRWLCNCFGRLRRFPTAYDYKLEGEFERQAMNYPIQSMIASLVDRWVSVLHQARERLLDEFKEYLFYWELQIHDALRFRIKPQYVEYMSEVLLPWSLQQVPIYPTKLDGKPIANRGPYYLGVEVEVGSNWGEKLALAECSRLGVPLQYGKG